MSIHKKKTTIKAFIASEFGCFSLAWMFQSSKLNSRVNKLYEKTLRIQIRQLFTTEISSCQSLCKTHSIIVRTQKLGNCSRLLIFHIAYLFILCHNFFFFKSILNRFSLLSQFFSTKIMYIYSSLYLGKSPSLGYKFLIKLKFLETGQFNSIS